MSAKSFGQLALVFLLLGGSALLFWRSSNRPRIDFNPYQALGSVAAEEVHRALDGKGRIVVVLPEPGPDPDPVLDSQIAAFKEALGRLGQVSIDAFEGVTMDPFLRMRTGGAVPPEQFVALKERHPGVSGIVFFIGFPALPSSDLDALQKSPIRLMVVSAALPGYDDLLRRSVLQFAIVPRAVTPDSPAPLSSATLREIFDQEYVILRADKAETAGQ